MRRLFGTRVFVDSCGLRPDPEALADPFVTVAMDEIGIDLSRHRAKSFDDLEDSSFDVVISLSPEAQHRGRRTVPRPGRGDRILAHPGPHPRRRLARRDVAGLPRRTRRPGGAPARALRRGAHVRRLIRLASLRLALPGGAVEHQRTALEALALAIGRVDRVGDRQAEPAGWFRRTEHRAGRRPRRRRRGPRGARTCAGRSRHPRTTRRALSCPLMDVAVSPSEAVGHFSRPLEPSNASQAASVASLKIFPQVSAVGGGV